jgi:hypothetical protein
MKEFGSLSVAGSPVSSLFLLPLNEASARMATDDAVHGLPMLSMDFWNAFSHGSFEPSTSGLLFASAEGKGLNSAFRRFLQKNF